MAPQYLSNFLTRRFFTAKQKTIKTNDFQCNIIRFMIKTIINHNRDISIYFLLITFIVIIFVSYFIVNGEQWLGKLNYYLFFLFFFGCCVLIATRANENIIISTLILFSTFNADYPLIYHPQIVGGTRPVPEIWLVDVPLIVLIGKYVLQGRFSFNSISVDKKFKALMILLIFWQLMTIFNALDFKSVVFQTIKDLRYFFNIFCNVHIHQ